MVLQINIPDSDPSPCNLAQGWKGSSGRDQCRQKHPERWESLAQGLLQAFGEFSFDRRGPDTTLGYYCMRSVGEKRRKLFQETETRNGSFGNGNGGIGGTSVQASLCKTLPHPSEACATVTQRSSQHCQQLCLFACDFCGTVGPERRPGVHIACCHCVFQRHNYCVLVAPSGCPNIVTCSC